MLRSFILSLFIGIVARPVGAAELSIGPANSFITASVRYTLIGKYIAGFDRFKGTITLDDMGMLRSVTLDMDAASMHSKFPTLDKLARSPTLLNTKKYAAIIFHSVAINRTVDGYHVKGRLSAHGVTRDVEFPVTVDALIITDGKILMRAHGMWPIARKDFGVTWNKYLDRGGVVVGDTIMVNWSFAVE